MVSSYKLGYLAYIHGVTLDQIHEDIRFMGVDIEHEEFIRGSVAADEESDVEAMNRFVEQLNIIYDKN